MCEPQHEWMNECLMTPQHEKQIGYWVSEKGKCVNHNRSQLWSVVVHNEWTLTLKWNVYNFDTRAHTHTHAHTHISAPADGCLWDIVQTNVCVL